MSAYAKLKYVHSETTVVSNNDECNVCVTVFTLIPNIAFQNNVYRKLYFS